MAKSSKNTGKGKGATNPTAPGPGAYPIDPQIDKLVYPYMYALGHYLKDPEARRRVPGAAVVVRKDDQIIHLNCYGYANLETEEKITPATLFDLGSVSKQFTAFAVLDLVYLKLIDLEDPISKFFTGFPRYADEIKVKDLIHHTSALPDYIQLQIASREADEGWYDDAMARPDDWYPHMASRKKNEVTNKDVLGWIASQRLLPHEPNAEFEYSNSGYVMLAELVESVSQMRFADYLKERVFKQLGMEDTFVFDETCAFAPDAPQVVNHAKCYNRVKGEAFVPVGYTPLNFIYGDGNVHSTIVDLGLWDLQLHWLEKTSLGSGNKSDQKFAAKLRELMWTPVQVEKRKRVDYGAGWNLLRDSDEAKVVVNGKKVMRRFESRAEYHRGEWLGWQSYIARGSRWIDCEPGEDIELDSWESLGIVVLTNNKQFDTCGLAKNISQVYWGNLKKDNIMNRFDC